MPPLLDTWRETLQVVFLLLATLYALRALARTPGRNAAYGIGALLTLYLAMKAFELKIIAGVLERFLEAGLVILVVLFRDETRALLGHLGRHARSLWHTKDEERTAQLSKTADAIAAAAVKLSEWGKGALIAVEGEDPLDDFAANGHAMNSRLFPELLEAIFASRSPLHDGAVIVRQQQILAAGSVLPLSEGARGTSRIGTRHRAALGLSERTDASVIVVSEERGTISVAKGGRLIPVHPETARRELLSLLTTDILPESNRDEARERFRERIRQISAFGSGLAARFATRRPKAEVRPVPGVKTDPEPPN